MLRFRTDWACGARHHGRYGCGARQVGLRQGLEGRLGGDRPGRDLGKISPEQLSGVNRMALRAYDVCHAGDEVDARELFARIERISN